MNTPPLTQRESQESLQRGGNHRQVLMDSIKTCLDAASVATFTQVLSVLQGPQPSDPRQEMDEVNARHSGRDDESAADLRRRLEAAKDSRS
jgi:hypothetical protein